MNRNLGAARDVIGALSVLGDRFDVQLAVDISGLQPADLLQALDSAQREGLVVVEGGLVALGGGESGPRLLASADGTSWRDLQPPAGSDATTTLTGALVTNGRAFLTGQTEVGGRAIGAIWTGPATLLAP